MHVHRTLDSLRHEAITASSCAIGMFDGVHAGHRMVFESALREARLHCVPSVVFSFANHPQALLSKTPTKLLSSLEERLTLFEAAGFDHALILDFDEALKNLSAMDFIRTILMETLHVRCVCVGYDHHFGAGRRGDGAFLTQMGLESGFEVRIMEPVRVQEQIVSSTLIRKLIAYGNMEEAVTLLGHPYMLCGVVSEGEKRGRQLGFPTANLQVDPQKLVPAEGVYAGVAVLAGKPCKSVCNIGQTPTFGENLAKKIEVHLIDYTGQDFYGQTLTMNFYRKVRDEKKFLSAEDLMAQIQQDCNAVESGWLETYR